MESTPSQLPEKKDALFERLKLTVPCPVCGLTFTGSEAHILQEYGESHEIHLTCRGCHGALMALVVVSPAGVSSVYGRTDLTVVDMIRLRHREPVSEDGLLHFHTYLQKKHLFEHKIISQA